MPLPLIYAEFDGSLRLRNNFAKKQIFISYTIQRNDHGLDDPRRNDRSTNSIICLAVKFTRLRTRFQLSNQLQKCWGTFSLKNETWLPDFRRRLYLWDAAAIIVAIGTGQWARFGLADAPSIDGSPDVSYFTLSAILAITWWTALALFQSREIQFLGYGLEEYRRVVSASFTVFAILAILSYAFQYQTARGYVAITLPLGIALILTARFLLRKRLIHMRQRGQGSNRVVVLGSQLAVEHLAHTLERAPGAGYTIVSTLYPDTVNALVGQRHASANVASSDTLVQSPTSTESQFTADYIVESILATGASALAVTDGAELTPRELRKLGWALHERGISLIMAPVLTDIAGPRFHTQPVAGLPLIHVSAPELSGWEAGLKRVLDVVGSLILLTLLSPLFAIVAAGIKISSPGPVFYSQTRIGQNGEEFKMFKFRSMIVNADAQLAELLAAQGTADKPLFKVDNDPRITRIGGFIRKYSIDELPQLVNVLLGSMSLVGPRPQREDEVALYSDAAFRRLMVRPGMSGLWQVSGRSNLSWEEAIRLDLYYVENWSLLQDIMILFRTAGAVLQKDGAV